MKEEIGVLEVQVKNCWEATKVGRGGGTSEGAWPCWHLFVNRTWQIWISGLQNWEMNFKSLVFWWSVIVAQGNLYRIMPCPPSNLLWLPPASSPCPNWPRSFHVTILRESVPRQVDESGGPKEERGVWGFQGGAAGLEFSRRRKGQLFFPTLLCLSQCYYVSCSRTCFSLTRTFWLILFI